MKIFTDDEEKERFIEHINELIEDRWHPHKETEKGPLLFTKQRECPHLQLLTE